MRFLLALCLLVLSGFASAAKYVTDRYDVRYAIDRRGTIEVTETIAVRFTERQHGLILKKPFRTRAESGQVREVRYALEGAKADSNPVNAKVSIDGGDWQIRLGSADVWVNGPVTYTVRYKIERAMTPIDKQDRLGPRTEFQWNLLPTKWATDIDASTMTVTFPKPQKGIVRARVLAGPRGTRKGVQVDLGGARVGRSDLVSADFRGNQELDIKLKQPMSSGNSVTLVLALPGDTVEADDPMIYTPNAPVTSDAPSFPRIPEADGNPLFGLIGLLPGLIIFFTSRVRWPGPKKPLVVRFDPPLGIGPSLSGTIIDSKVNQHDIVAGIVSLAQKGALRLIHPNDEVSGVTIELLGLERARDADQSEQYLYSALAQFGPIVSPEMLRGAFGQQYQTMVSMLTSEAQQRGFMHRAPVKPLLGCFLVVLAVPMLIGLIITRPPTAILFIPIGIVLAIVGMAKMTDLTPAGQDVQRDLLGLKEFITRAQQQELNYMAQVSPDQALFEKLLPYAVAFDAVKQWTRAFEGINIQMPDWYDAPGGGSDMFWTAMLLNDLTSVQHDYGNAMTYVPPSTSFGTGSGFSSGDSGFGDSGGWSDSGGFDSGSSSGDGGGGGGGDSW